MREELPSRNSIGPPPKVRPHQRNHVLIAKISEASNFCRTLNRHSITYNNVITSKTSSQNYKPPVFTNFYFKVHFQKTETQ